MNRELTDVQAGFRKGRGTRDQIANIRWIIEKAREFQKNICFIVYAEAFDYVDHNKLWKILKDMGIPDHLTCLWEICMHVKKQQLEPDMEQQIRFILEKEYIKTVYCHSAYLTYMQSTSCEMPGWMKHKLESRLPGEISITSDMQICISDMHMTLCRWHYPYSRNGRVTEDLLDESERGECWFKIQHSKN